MAIVSAVAALCLVVPALVSVVYLGEALSAANVTGPALAVVAVVLIAM
ncbi:MAG: hypothetical protein ABEJ05_09865 [Haloglomus sp.]